MHPAIRKNNVLASNLYFAWLFACIVPGLVRGQLLMAPSQVSGLKTLLQAAGAWLLLLGVGYFIRVGNLYAKAFAFVGVLVYCCYTIPRMPLLVADTFCLITFGSALALGFGVLALLIRESFLRSN